MQVVRPIEGDSCSSIRRFDAVVFRRNGFKKMFSILVEESIQQDEDHRFRAGTIKLGSFTESLRLDTDISPFQYRTSWLFAAKQCLEKVSVVPFVVTVDELVVTWIARPRNDLIEFINCLNPREDFETVILYSRFLSERYDDLTSAFAGDASVWTVTRQDMEDFAATADR